MRRILGWMVMASVVFGASLTSINTQEGTGKSGRKRGTVCNHFALSASKSVGQAKGFIRNNFPPLRKLPAKYCSKFEVINIVSVPRSKYSGHVNFNI